MSEVDELTPTRRGTSRRRGEKPAATAAASEDATPLSNSVWVPDEERGYVAAEVKSRNQEAGEVVVELTQEKITKTFKIDAIQPMNPPNLNKCEDMARLSYLHESTVLHNLRERYADDGIYTYSGLFLVAINPYKKLPIYTNEVITQYKGKRREDCPPHVFSLADTAYMQMLQNKQNQSMLVTGESGAGKTENTKKVIQYLTAIAGTEGGSGKLEQQLLRTNPLLEAFGNAKTLRNNNSSRFGKFIEIDFDVSGYIAGCKIQNYLLENTRVVHQNPGERNFHFFYQIIADPAAKAKYQLSDINAFEYVNHSGCTVVSGIDDKKEFTETMNSMEVIGINEGEREEICSIIAGILHLGNVQFTKDAKEKAQISDKTSFNTACKFFGVDPGLLEEALVRPTIVAGADRVKTAADVEQAIANKNALAKSTYNRLFEWLVKRINESLAAREQIKNFIGVLDIAGFEIFDVNSFEQLCINYTNEKLQQFFNHHMFKREQEEYLREQIEWKFMDFGLDLQPTIDLIEKPLGVLAILDQQTFLPGTDEKSLAREVIKNHKEKTKFFHTSRMDETLFSIVHYAGEVPYKTQGWIYKNLDPLNDDSKNAMGTSSNKVIQVLFTLTSEEKAALAAAAQKKGTGSRFNTVSNNYKNQLKSLMSVLESTEPHFIRCIVPNGIQRPGIIDAKIVLHQLKCNGVLEGIRIVRKGFPGRIVYKEFEKRFQLLAKKQDIQQQTVSRERCRVILEAANLTEGKHFKLGLTKVFLKSGVEAMVEEMRERRIAQIVVVVQAAIRGQIARKGYGQLKDKIVAVKVIQRNWRSYFTMRDYGWYQLYAKARPLVSSWKEDQRRREQQEEFENLKRKKAEEERERKNLEEEKKQLELEAAKLEVDINQEKNNQENSKKEIQNINVQIKELEATIESASKEKRDTDEEKLKLITLAQEKDAKARAKEEEINAMIEKQKLLQKEIENMRKILQDKEVKGTQLETAVKNAEEEMAQWKQKYEKEQQRGIETERIRASLEEKIRDLTFNSETLARQKLDADNKNKQLQEESSTKRKEVGDVNDQIGKLTDDLNALKIQLQTKGDELKSRMVTLDNLELEKKRVDNDMANLNERFNEEQRRRTRLENDLKNAKHDQQELENQYNKLSSDKATLEDQLAKAKEEFNALKAKFAELHEINIQLETKKGNLERELRELELKSSEEKEINKQTIMRLQQKLEEQTQELNGSLNEANNQKTNLDRKLRAQEKTYRDLVRNLEDLTKAKEEIDAKIKTLEAQIIDLTNQLNVEKKKVTDLEESKRQLDFEFRATKDKIEFLKEDAVRADGRYKKVASELLEALDKVEHLEKEKQDLSGRSTEGNKVLQQAKTDLASTKTAISQLSGERDQLSIAVKGLNAKIQSQQDQLSSLTNNIKAKSDEAANLLSELEQETNQKKNLERKLATLEGQVKNLQQRVDEEDGRLKEETGRKEQAENKARELELTLASTNGAIEDLSKKVQAAEKQLATLQASAQDASSQIGKLRSEKRELEHKQEELDAKVGDLESALANTTQAVKELQTQINDASAKMEAEKQQRTTLEQENIKTKSDLDRKKDELATDLIKNKATLDKLRQQLEFNESDFERQLKKLTDERNDLKKQIKVKSQNQKEDTGIDREALEKIKREYEGTVAKLTAQLNEQQNIRSDLEYKRKELEQQTQALREKLDNEERARKKAEQQYKALAVELDEIKELADEAEELRHEVEKIRAESTAQVTIIKGDLDKEKEKRKAIEDGINAMKRENDQLKQDIETEKKKEGEAVEKLKAQFESELQEMETNLNKMKKEKVNATKIIKKLERENRELSRKITVESQFKLDIDSKASNQDRELQKIKGDLEFNAKNAIKFESENQRLTRELSEFKEKSNRLEDELNNLRDSLNKEKKKLQKVQRSFQMSMKGGDSDDDV